MIEQSTFATGLSWKGVIRWGGLALFVAGGIVLLFVVAALVLRQTPMGALVMTAGVLSFFSPFAVMMHIPLMIPFSGLVLMGVWQVVAGLRLFRLGAGA
jgi:hypothetical protein